MTIQRHHIAVGALLVTLSFLVWWLPRVLNERTTFFDSARREPDYTIENFTATAMDPQGRRKHELRAVKLRHFPDDDTSELDRPYLIQFPPDGPPVHTRADSGIVSPDGKEILMRHNVHVTRGASGNDPGGEVTTQEMRVRLE
ncbi:MAG: LPS export ABC transporter periplasmic protein LptC [Gammaproteobacteria bacterium]|nr:LPS export ABC transporter periplasmic protein LptC [Gammaproteobacteria bacterium]